MTRPRVLLTNDDGIDSPALAALRDGLRTVADVTVVAPADDQSGVGRARSRRVTVERDDHGYAVDGTPADCVAYALRGLDRSFDAVVSGCNLGPNVGDYVLGRSGTVGAAVEAGFLGTPAVAVSGYHPSTFFPTPAADFDFRPAVDVTCTLLEQSLATDVFDAVDVLNVNAPVARRAAEADGGDASVVDVDDTNDRPSVRLTRPLADFDTDVSADGGEVEFVEAFWSRTGEGGFALDEGPAVARTLADNRDLYPEGTDRRAVIDGAVSVSPLSLPQTAVESDAVRDLVASFGDDDE